MPNSKKAKYPILYPKSFIVEEQVMSPEVLRQAVLTAGVALGQLPFKPESPSYRDVPGSPKAISSLGLPYLFLQTPSDSSSSTHTPQKDQAISMLN